jgi:hypothetical protein
MQTAQLRTLADKTQRPLNVRYDELELGSTGNLVIILVNLVVEQERASIPARLHMFAVDEARAVSAERNALRNAEPHTLAPPRSRTDLSKVLLATA